MCESGRKTEKPAGIFGDYFWILMNLKYELRKGFLCGKENLTANTANKTVIKDMVS